MALKIGRAPRARLLICILGAGMLSVGIAGVVRVLFSSHPNEIEFLNISLTAMIMGSVFLGQGVLAKYRTTVDEAYNFGHDVGVEEGFRRGREIGRPVVVDLTYPKQNDGPSQAAP